MFFALTFTCLKADTLWAGGEETLLAQLRGALEEQFHDSFAALRSEYGLHPFLSGGENAGREGRSVILVHGLDDPGLIWCDLAPALAGLGFRVFVMSYPNDQLVRDSSLLFFKELQEFAVREGAVPVAVVAHSMGGLVTREMLTSPAIGYEKAREDGLVPPLSHFIMVGTPNHGSVFSRLRLLTELRDQMVVGMEKGFHWLRPIADGLGEAAKDLYPGSDFLTELNSRPLPAAGRMLVIAGVLNPFELGETVAILREASEAEVSVPKSMLPQTASDSLVEKMVDQVGDGLVSVESARLSGVPLVQVHGTHVTIIRNLGSDTFRVPPAIPVILAELKKIDGFGPDAGGEKRVGKALGQE